MTLTAQITDFCEARIVSSQKIAHYIIHFHFFMYEHIYNLRLLIRLEECVEMSSGASCECEVYNIPNRLASVPLHVANAIAIKTVFSTHHVSYCIVYIYAQYHTMSLNLISCM